MIHDTPQGQTQYDEELDPWPTLPLKEQCAALASKESFDELAQMSQDMGLYESAPQEANPANPVSNVDSPAGAAPLPDEVANLIERLTAPAQAGKVICAEAADMIERLVREKWQQEQFANRYLHDNNQLRARIAELEKQHEGWQLVPKVITDEMYDAWADDDGDEQTAWSALLSAAPTPPEQGEGN